MSLAPNPTEYPEEPGEVSNGLIKGWVALLAVSRVQNFTFLQRTLGWRSLRISVSSGIGCSRVSFPAVFQRGRYYPVDTMKAQSCGGIGRFHRPVPGPSGSRYAGPAQRLLRRVASFLQPLSSPADTRQLF